jgi:hypothetical protein
MERTPRGPLPFTSVSRLAHGRLCPLLGYKPHICSFFLFHSLLASDYDYGSRGSCLMVLPNYYLVSSYKSALCATTECYLRVFGLFLFIALSSESSFIHRTSLALNSALLLLNAARLPRACAPAALPRGSDLSAPCQAPLEVTLNRTARRRIASRKRDGVQAWENYGPARARVRGELS